MRPGAVAQLTQGTFTHAPTAWIGPGSFDSGPGPNRCFPWQARLPGSSLGVHVCRAPPPTLSALGGCGGEVWRQVPGQGSLRRRCGPAGHHAQTCVCHSLSAYHRARGHTDLLAIWKELS
eukprot:1303073-Rhodomonas_salina.1